MNIKTSNIRFNNDWIEIKNKCRTTVNKEPTPTEPKSRFKVKLLISEHSPIRLLEAKWSWKRIKSWISVHFVRHWLGWDKWVSTQRDDRTGLDRDKSTQDTPVNIDVKANAQSLINVSRYRLCYGCAHKETREYMEDLKQSIKIDEPELADVMVPNCIYRCGCPEFTPCGFWNNFKSKTTEDELTNIYLRYMKYSEWLSREEL